jgi:hypothetical protein
MAPANSQGLVVADIGANFVEGIESGTLSKSIRLLE